MPKIVPTRNIDPVFVDIKNPNLDYGNFARFTSLNLGNVPQPPAANSAKRIFTIAAISVLIIFLGYSASVFFGLRDSQDIFAEKGKKVAQNFSSAVHEIREFDPKEASVHLSQNQTELENLNKLLRENHGQVLFGAVGNIVPFFKKAGSLLGEVTSFNLNFLKIADKLSDLQTNGFKYFLSDGAALIVKLNETRELMQATRIQIESVRNTMADLKDVSPFFDNFNEVIDDQYLKYSSDLQRWDKALISFLGIIGSPTDKHIILFFQNPAEIRPGGGFIGSYADLTVANGEMKSIDVQDIYWPDHPMNFKLKVVPPEPLQTITEDWGARDANWFFDFPTSAKTVLRFLESSKIYEEQNIKFEGAVGVNIHVLETILDFIGPISLEEYGLVIDKNNFLIELQREVEAGRDKKKGENPKRILKVLTPFILERLNQLPSDDLTKLFERFKEHIAKKDIMIFARDADLANALSESNVNGAVFALPNNFWGSYLAVVNANIAGGKSDAFIQEMIEGRFDVDTDGGIFTDLTITRTHRGNQEKDPWWRAENKNFIQIFVNPGSSLVSLKGSSAKFRTPNIDYKILNYETLGDLSAIENTKIFLSNFSAWTMEAFGKTVFAAWFNTPAGETGTLNVRYQTPGNRQTFIAPGRVFQFVFEKQSGVKSGLRLKIGAPLGYSWSESKSSVFTYEIDDPDARLIINLTLDK